MILNRISDNLKKQNWTAVVLEFLIVLAGVYIASLLASMNNARQDEALYEQTYDRMIEEMRVNVRELEALRGDIVEPLAIVQRAISDLRACRTDEAALANVQASFEPLGRAEYISLSLITLEQLVENQSYLRFQSPELRNRLLLLLTSLRENEATSRRIYTEAGQAVFDERVIERSPLVYSGPDEIVSVVMSGAARTPDLVRQRRLSVPLSDVCQDGDFLAVYYAWEGNAYYQSVFSALVAGRLREELESLGQPMEPAEAS